MSKIEEDRVAPFHKMDIVGCARCHGDGHKDLVFYKLTHPMVTNDDVYSHWAECPTNGEPIMLAFAEIEPEGEVPVSK
jgi:hypothetical protein